MLNRAGATDDLLTGTVPWEVWDEYTSDGKHLGGSPLVKSFPERYGWPCVGFSRTKIQLCLRDVAARRGIEYHQGWKLADIRETEDGLVAVADDGREIAGQFLIGCDGLKSRTREIILAKMGVPNLPPTYTNISVVSITPEEIEIFRLPPAGWRVVPLSSVVEKCNWSELLAGLNNDGRLASSRRWLRHLGRLVSRARIRP